MSGSINTQNLNQTLGIGQQGSQTQEVVAKGSYRGEQVTQTKSPQSLLADAAEEMTFAASEKVEKNLAKRKATAGGGIKSEILEQAEKYLQQVHSKQPPEKLEQLLANLKKRGDDNPDEILRQARQSFGDATDQYTALEFVEKMLGDEGDETLQQAVKSAMAKAMEEDGPAIRAGLNIAEAIAQHSQGDLDSDQQLRDFYRNTLFQHEGLADTYQNLCERHGEDKFADTVQFLLKALSDDLGSKGPSIGPTELKVVIDDVYRLEVLTGVHEECSALVDKMIERGAAKKGSTGHDLMKELLKLKEERFIQGSQVDKIANNVGVRDLEPRIYFLRELKEVARAIPLKAYEDVGNREKLLDAIQEALDDAIDLEDEELE